MRHAIITTSIAVVALAVTGFVAVRTFFPKTVPDPTPVPIVFQPTVPIAASDDPRMGAINPKHTIIMFGDFQCQSCAQVSTELKTVLANNPDAQLVWKDAPNTLIHPWSMEAAIAGRCAHQQSQFWNFHDALFAAPFADTQSIIARAQSLGLDMQAFQNCRIADATRKRVQASLIQVQTYGIQATPYFYINGKPAGTLNTAKDFEPYLK